MRVNSAIVLLLLASEVTAQNLGETAERERKRREALGKTGGSVPAYSDRDFGEPAWTGWHKWRAVDNSFTVEMPERPHAEHDSVPIGAPYMEVRRVIYRAGDAAGKRYAVAVADYPAEYVRLHASQIWVEFQGSAHLPFDSNDNIIVRATRLDGYDAMLFKGGRFELVGCLLGTRFYQLMVEAPPGDFDLHTPRLHPFFDSFHQLQ